MAAIEHSYEWDVYLSYAQSDNYITPRLRNWVRMFKDYLQDELRIRSGRDINIFYDIHELKHGEALEVQLENVRNSRVFLAIGSPNYVNSSWCIQEANAFLAQHAEPPRLFIAEFLPLREEQNYPPPLSDILRAVFWHQDDLTQAVMPLTSRNTRFARNLATLAEHIVRALEEIGRAEAGVPAPARPAPNEARTSTPPQRAANSGRRIFISYAREDKMRITPLVELLEKKGHVVWWDRHVPWGISYQKAIAAELQAADIILVIWSRNSVGSDPVLEEADIGKERQCLRPVKIDQVTLPFGFRLYQALDLTEWSGAENDEAIQDLLKKLA